MKKLSRKPSFIISILIFLLVLIFTSVYFLGSDALQKKQAEILSLERDLTSVKIRDEFKVIETIIENLENYLLTQSNQEDLKEYLVAIKENNALVSEIYFGRPDNTWEISSDVAVDPGYDVRVREWYIEAIANNTFYYGDAYIDALINRIIITASYPVYDEDVLLGVIGVDIETSQITDYIDELMDDDFAGIAFLIDGESKIISYPGITYEGIEFEYASEYDIPINLFNEDLGFTDTITHNSVKGKIAYSQIENTDYVFGVFMPNAVLNQTLRVFSYVSFAIVALIVVVTMVIYFIFQYFIYRPMNHLIADIRNINLVERPNYRLNTNKSIGFESARRELNELLDITVAYQKVSAERLQEIRLRNQKYNLLLDSASDIVFQVDNNFRYTEIYGKGLEVLEMTESDFLGKTYREVFKDELGHLREAGYLEVMSGRRVVYTWEYNNSEGKIYFETVLSPLYDINNEIIGIVGVTRDVTEQQIRYEEMLHVSTHDHLTGLYNRRFYYQKMDQMDNDKKYPYAIFNIDVNGLKIINDAYGHHVGDLTLKKTAEIISENVGKEDIVSRVSGDEFTIIVPDASEQSVAELKTKLQKAFAKEKVSNMTLSVAIGYYLKKDDSVNPDEVRRLAENDMFRHKIAERQSVKNKAISAILKTLTDKYEAERIHSDRVKDLSVKLGKALDLEADDLNALGIAAMFHDIGKISIPDEILNKPSTLTDREYEIMKAHTETGYEILRAADEYSELAIHASSHHERWDGLGYPKGLKGNQIPKFSRIICIADAYEAMTSDRPYRKKLSEDYAASEIIKYAGTQFDPQLARIFVEKVLKRKWIEKA